MDQHVVGLNASEEGILQSDGFGMALTTIWTLWLVFSLMLSTLYFAGKAYSPRVDASEPPLLNHSIPFLGHLLGLIRHGVAYFDNLCAKTGLPISTVPVLNSKVYVITSPDLVMACMKETRTLSFNIFITEVFRRMTGMSHDELKPIRQDMDNRSVPHYMADLHKAQYAALAPGPALDQMNREALESIAASLLNLSEDQTLSLFQDLRDITAMASVRATWGLDHPFKQDPTLLQSFWYYEENLKTLLLEFFPSIFIPKAVSAKNRIAEAFLDFYNRGAWEQAAPLVKERRRVALKYGVDTKTIAALDIGVTFGLLSNAVNVVGWLVTIIYSDSELLAKIRQETKHFVHMASSDSTAVTFDFQSDPYIRQTCPILTSTFHETLRHVSASLSSGRYVLEDTILQSKDGGRPYLLKKGFAIQIPSQSLHFPQSQQQQQQQQKHQNNEQQEQQQKPKQKPEPSLSILENWEYQTQDQQDSTTQPASTTARTNTFTTPDRHTFNPTRFTTLSSTPETSHNGSFRAFGGGSTLCPGRKFAFVKIIGLTIMFVHMFDLIEPGSGSGSGSGFDGESESESQNDHKRRKHQKGISQIPTMETGKIAIAVAKPKHDLSVRLVRRHSFSRVDDIDVRIGGGRL